jgi:metal-responsive CopG/Arc/MetJ family transcriptional regulator
VPRQMNEEKKKRKFGGVSIPTGILEEIDVLIDKLRYWPSRAAFVREACLEKIRNEKDRLKSQA